MYQVSPLPDFILTVSLKLAATALPANARRRGIIDLTQLRTNERPDIILPLALVFKSTMEPVAGIFMRELAIRDIVESDARLDRHSQLWVEIENVTNAPVTFEAVCTLYAIARGVLDEGQVPVAPPALSNVPMEFATTTMVNVPIVANWAAI
jgi:hypothetical protein